MLHLLGSELNREQLETIILAMFPVAAVPGQKVIR